MPRISNSAGSDSAGGSGRVGALRTQVAAADTEGGADMGSTGVTLPVIGTGSRVMNRLRQQVASQKQKGRDQTIGYLDKSLADTQQERFFKRQQEEAAASAAAGDLDATMAATAEINRLNRQLAATNVSRSLDSGYRLTTSR